MTESTRDRYAREAVLFAATSNCFSFLSPLATEMSILRVLATMSAGVSASHCVREMSWTRSLLYISIHTRSSVSDVFSI
jgi:hypothetical protein